MDDECYFSLETPKWADKYYYEQNDSCITKNGKFIAKSKFPQKVMMWIAISENGKSKPVFFKGISSVNTSVYVEKCLPKLESYINRYHKDENILFWPDLASCHTSETTLKTLKNMNIRTLPKIKNPPNSPPPPRYVQSKKFGLILKDMFMAMVLSLIQ